MKKRPATRERDTNLRALAAVQAATEPRMVRWQHDETGMICEMPESESPGRRYEEIPEGAPRQPEKDPAAVSLGRRGGLKGGRARAEKLTPERRREIARKAAAARWGKKDE